MRGLGSGSSIAVGLVRGLLPKLPLLVPRSRARTGRASANLPASAYGWHHHNDRPAMLALLVSACPALQQQVRAHRSEVSGELVTPWRGSTVRELHAEYSNIFRHGNRNAASHLWTTFLLDRAPFLSSKTLLHLASGYCAISGSPVHPSPSTRYRMSLERVDGSGRVAGSMFYCCWPCVCDTNDFIRVDSKTVATAHGHRTLNVTVIGDPCLASGMLNKPFLQPFDKRMTTIAAEAQEVRCGKQGLEGATYSDHGYVIIGLFFAPGRQAQDGSSFDSMCTDRANAGYNSGMRATPAARTRSSNAGSLCVARLAQGRDLQAGRSHNARRGRCQRARAAC